MQGRGQGAGNRKPLAHNGEEGYLLLGAVVAIALVMIALSVAAVKVSFELRREREVESVRRANQYVRAIREYYLKFGRYPGSVDQLVNTNNARFLRQKYVDPLTGKADYRLIIVGQNKTQPTGFFGEPLGGLPGTGVGGTGNTAIGGTANGAGATQSSSANTATMGFGGSGTAQSATGGTQSVLGAAAGVGVGVGTQGPATQNNTSSTTGVGLSGSGGPASGAPGTNLGPIMGVGSSAKGPSIIAVHDQTTYDTWEFLYDPRVEQLRQAGQLNSGVSSAGGSSNPAGLGGAAQPGAAGTTPGAGGTSAGGTNAPPGGTPTNGQPPAQP